MARSLYARLHRRFGPPTDAMTRREMLRATAAAAAGVLVSRVPTFAEGSAKPTGKHIVIVGAGFAGLACAYELVKAGYGVTVVEARNRFGGRVLSFGDFIEGRNVEGGGELIGSNHPTWVAYAEQFGLQFLDVTEDESLESPIVLGGRRLSTGEAVSLYEAMTAALSTMNADAVEIDADEPWKSANAAALDQRTVADWIDGLSASDLCKRAIRAQLSADNAVPVARQSYLGHLAMVRGGDLERFWTDSEVYRCRGGNQQLAVKLAREVGEERILLGRPVTEIVRAEKSVAVKCADGRTIEGDECVLAAPPTVWPKIAFAPELPADIRPQIGVAVKHLSSLKERFWKRRGLGPDAFTDGRVSMTWDGTDGQGDDGGAALVAFSGGEAAEKCLALHKDRVDPEYQADVGSLYPGYAEQLVGSRFMDWPRDPWTLGGYSFPAPGEVTTVGPLLHKGLGHDGRARLHFAGEHACYKFAGYMEGALNSGVSLARRIAKGG